MRIREPHRRVGRAPAGSTRSQNGGAIRACSTQLTTAVEQEEVKLPPAHIDDGPDGVRQDLESLGVFLHLGDGRGNIPDVFRVGYGIGRKVGVKPVR